MNLFSFLFLPRIEVQDHVKFSILSTVEPIGKSGTNQPIRNETLLIPVSYFERDTGYSKI